MKLELVRVARKPNYTIGKLYVNGTYFCDTLEDTDRSLRSEMSFNEIANLKIKGKTAIPYGTYAIDLDTPSPRFGSQAFYKEVCGGKLPRLVNVNGYEGVLIHVGNDDGDTDGCILVGYNTVVGKVTNSKDAFRRLTQTIYARPAGEAVTLEVKKKQGNRRRSVRSGGRLNNVGLWHTTSIIATQQTSARPDTRSLQKNCTQTSAATPMSSSECKRSMSNALTSCLTARRTHLSHLT